MRTGRRNVTKIKRDIRIASVYCLLSVVNCWTVDRGSADSRVARASKPAGEDKAPRKKVARGRRAKNFMMKCCF